MRERRKKNAHILSIKVHEEAEGRARRDETAQPTYGGWRKVQGTIIWLCAVLFTQRNQKINTALFGGFAGDREVERITAQTNIVWFGLE